MNLTQSLKQEYAGLWSSCTVRAARSATVDALVDRIVANRRRYEEAARRSGVPWHVVAVIHMLEASGDFSRHLHNGDPLTARTVHVPAGRPASGRPPFGWEESAADALALHGLGRRKDWSLPATLWVLERYNGFGYRPRGIPTPYLWSFSNHYTKGKYVADGRFSPTAVSAQCGAAVLLKRMAERGLISVEGGARRTLRRGMRGTDVRELKRKLRAWFDANAPGRWGAFAIKDGQGFGAGVEAAVRELQQLEGLGVDGVAGRDTWAVLDRS